MTRANWLRFAKVISLVRFLVVSRPSPEQLDSATALLPLQEKQNGKGGKTRRELCSAWTATQPQLPK